jgi:hypothetical protein
MAKGTYSRNGHPFEIGTINRGYLGTCTQMGKPIRDQDLNAASLMAQEQTRILWNESFDDSKRSWGWTNISSMTISKDQIHVNRCGFVVDGIAGIWDGFASVLGTANILSLPSPKDPAKAILCWLEVWIGEVGEKDTVYLHGNQGFVWDTDPAHPVQYAAHTFKNDLIDANLDFSPILMAQVKYRTRATEVSVDPLPRELRVFAEQFDPSKPFPGEYRFETPAERKEPYPNRAGYKWLGQCAGTNAQAGNMNYSIWDGRVFALPICLKKPGQDPVDVREVVGGTKT